MRSLGSLAAVLCLLLAAMPAVAKTVDKDFHETFDVEEGAALHITSGDGDVTIEPWDKDIVDVKVRYHAEFKGLKLGGEPDFDVDFKQDGHSIRVTGIESGGGFGIFYSYTRRYEYTYTISAPTYVRLHIVGDDGAIRLDGWRASIDCELDDGDVYMTDVETDRVRLDMEDGDLRIEALEADLNISADDGDISIIGSSMPNCRVRFNDGDLDVSDSSGAFDFTIDDGDIRIDRVAASRLDIRGEDGDMDIDLAKVDDMNVDIALDDGRVALTVEKGTSAAFTLDSDDGRIEVRAPGATRLEQGRNWATGELGDGAGRIRVRTADGSILLIEE